MVVKLSRILVFLLFCLTLVIVFDTVAIANSINTSAASRNHWAYDDYCYLKERGILNGSTAENFEPLKFISRSEFASMLSPISSLDISGQISFSDVTSNTLYEKDIEWVCDKGILKGVSSSNFLPDAKVKHEDMVVAFLRYIDYMGYKTKEVYNDVVFDESEINNYAKEAVHKMIRSGFINGDSEKRFLPKANTTQAEVIKILALIHQANEKQPNTLPIKADEVSHMIIQNGTNGDIVRIVNEDMIRTVSEHLNSASYIEFNEEEERGAQGGWSYWVKFYNGNKIIFQYILNSGASTKDDSKSFRMSEPDEKKLYNFLDEYYKKSNK